MSEVTAMRLLEERASKAFDRMSSQEKQAYLRAHPHSKYGREAAPSVRGSFGLSRAKNIRHAIDYVRAHGVPAGFYDGKDTGVGASYSPQHHAIGLNRNARVRGSASVNRQMFGKTGDMHYWQNPGVWTQYNHKVGWSSSPNPYHALDHEIGHAKYAAPDEWHDPAHQDLVRRHVSQYGSKTPNEFVAEHYAGTQAGRTFPREIDDLFRTYARERRP